MTDAYYVWLFNQDEMHGLLALVKSIEQGESPFTVHKQAFRRVQRTQKLCQSDSVVWTGVYEFQWRYLYLELVNIQDLVVLITSQSQRFGLPCGDAMFAELCKYSKAHGREVYMIGEHHLNPRDIETQCINPHTMNIVKMARESFETTQCLLPPLREIVYEFLIFFHLS